MTFRRSPWPLVAAIGVTVAVGIGGLAAGRDRAPTDGSRPQLPASTAQYVAIGDSFTAGGDIGMQQRNSGSCRRSSVNYPSLVARELGFSLTDVSCVGATTQQVLAGSRAVPSAQVNAVDNETDIVTVSIGGNDLRVFADMLFTCFRVSRPDSTGAPCRTAAGTSLTQRLPEVKRRLGSVLDEVRTRAPDSHIVVVTYVGLMPTETTCGSTPFAARDVSWFAGVEKSIAAAMAAAAKERNVEVVDGYALSEGHDVCTGRAAWVNGARPKTHDGLLYHPNGAGQRAVADAVVERLRRLRY